MSFKEYDPVMKLSPTELSLSPAEKFVLVAYAYHANAQTGESFPMHATVAKETGHSLRHVEKTVRKLVDLGLLRRVDTSVETVKKAEERAQRWARQREARREKEARRKQQNQRKDDGEDGWVDVTHLDSEP